MSNKFNARLTYKGEGELTFTLPVVGQISIYAGKDIYLKGATQDIVECLRQYRVMKLEHKLNGDSNGCYRVIEVEQAQNSSVSMFRSVMMQKASQASSISDLKAQMMKSNEIEKFDDNIITEAGQSTPEELQNQLDNKQKEEDEKIGLKESEETELDNEDNSEESEEIILPKSVADITVTVGNLRGKKISELDERGLRKVLRYSKNDTEKTAASKALEILFPAQ